MGKQFLIQMAVKPGALVDTLGANFYFHIMDYQKQTDMALYWMGRLREPPPIPNPPNWSVVNPAVVGTPEELGAAEWAGTAILSESNENGRRETSLIVAPDKLGGRMIRFWLRAHLNPPQRGETRSQSSTLFTLKEIGYQT